MKGQMKKLLGFQPPSLDMPPKSSQTFTKPIPLDPALCHLLSLDVFMHSDNSKRNHFSINSKKKSLYFMNFLTSIVYSFLSLTSDFSDSSPQSQSKYISVFSLILFLYYFHFTVHIPFQFFPNFSLFFLPFYSLQKPVTLTRHC